MPITRCTYVCRIQNHSQVAGALDKHGWSASKLWNVANYYARQQWDNTGEIPDEDELKHELKPILSTTDCTASPARKFSKSFLKPSVRGSAPTTTGTTHRATANATTTTATVTESTKNTLAVR